MINHQTYVLLRKGRLILTFLKYLDRQTIGQCMASAPPVNGELLVRGNVESELEETVAIGMDHLHAYMPA